MKIVILGYSGLLSNSITMVSYSKKKIRKELNFNPRFFLVKKIKLING
jgi:hypothetical protein